MKGYRVLAVDDSSTVRAVMARSLRLAGVDVQRFGEASDGAQALDLLRREPFDLVLCDLTMPGMSGFELVNEIRRDERLRGTPVVVVSSLVGSEDVASLEGVRAFLRKPFRPEEVRALFDLLKGAPHGA